MMNANKKRIIIICTAVIIILCAAAAIILLPNKSDVSVTEMLSTAQKYLVEMDYERAIAEFNKVIELDPMNAEAYLGLAEAYEKNGQHDMAVETLEMGYEATGDERIEAAIEAKDKSVIDDDTDKTEAVTETSEEVINELLAIREDYAGGDYCIFTYNSSDKSIASVDYFNKNNDRIGGAEYQYSDNDVKCYILCKEENVDLNNNYSIAQYARMLGRTDHSVKFEEYTINSDKKWNDEAESWVVSTQKNGGEDQPLVNVYDDSGEICEIHNDYEKWTFSDNKLSEYENSHGSVIHTYYSYDENGRIINEHSNTEDINYTYEYDEYQNPVHRRAEVIYSDGDMTDTVYETSYDNLYDKDGVLCFTVEYTNIDDYRMYYSAYGIETDRNGLPVKGMSSIRGASRNYNDLLYNSRSKDSLNEKYVTIYVPNYDMDKRIDQIDFYFDINEVL